MATANEINIHWPYYRIHGEFLRSALPYEFDYVDVAPRVHDAFAEHPQILLGSFEAPRNTETFTLIFRSNMGDPAAEDEVRGILENILPGVFENIWRVAATTAAITAGAAADIGTQVRSGLGRATDIAETTAGVAPRTLKWAAALGVIGLLGWLVVRRR